MSDSDDTDYLLLIPPNLFLVQSDDEFESKSKSLNELQFVSDLVNQVHDLDSRISIIEASRPTEIDHAIIQSSPLDNRESFVPCLNASQNYLDDIGLTAYDPLEIGTGWDFPLSKQGSFINSKTDVDKLHGENSFDLNSSNNSIMALYQKDVISSPSIPNYNPDSSKLELTEVDRLLKEMEVTQKEIENKLKSRETECDVISGQGMFDQAKKASMFLVGDNIGSVPDLGFGVRSMFSDTVKSTPQTKKPLPDQNPVIEEPCVRKNVSLLGSESLESETWGSQQSPSLRTPTQRNMVNLSKSPERKRLNYSARRRLSLNSEPNTPRKDEKSEPLSMDGKFASNIGNSRELNIGDGPSGQNAVHFRNIQKSQYQLQPPGLSYGGKLLSLTDLWKEEGDSVGRNPIKLRQKLEEEKYRRIHVESKLQELQKKVLEEQEKVAVAVQVDQKKDVVIEKVTEAWRQMVDHWRQIEEQRHAATQALVTERALIKQAQDDLNKKMTRWEKEVSQALDLAAGFKAKSEATERDAKKMEIDLKQMMEELENQLIEEKHKSANLRKEKDEREQKLTDAYQDISKERKVVEESQSKMSLLESESAKLEGELSVVKEQRELLSLRLKEERSRLGILENKNTTLASSLAESMEKQKLAEQGCENAKKELERIKSELRAVYQSQVESVVREKLDEFQQQLESARDEMRVQLEQEVAAVKEASARQQNQLINRHMVELRRLENYHREETRRLEIRLAESEARSSKLERGKSDLARKLHSIMEHQWQQTLDIITNEVSLRQQGEGVNGRGQVVEERMASTPHPSLQVPVDVHIPPQQKESQEEFSANSQLLKYIKLLLDKKPGKPLEGLSGTSEIQLDSTQASDFLDESGPEQPLKWGNHLQTNPDDYKSQSDKLSSRKPPWK